MIMKTLKKLMIDLINMQIIISLMKLITLLTFLLHSLSHIFAINASWRISQNMIQSD